MLPAALAAGAPSAPKYQTVPVRYVIGPGADLSVLPSSFVPDDRHIVPVLYAERECRGEHQ
jgi:hypothetical protein